MHALILKTKMKQFKPESSKTTEIKRYHRALQSKHSCSLSYMLDACVVVDDKLGWRTCYFSYLGGVIPAILYKYLVLLRSF